MSARKKHQRIVRADSMPSSKLSGIKLGLVVCAHGNAGAVRKLCQKYEQQGVDAIAVMGDMGDDFREISSVLKAANARVPVIVFPGNHEPGKDYYRAVKRFKKIIELSRKQRTTIKGHDLVALPSANVTTPEAGFRVIEQRRVPKAVAKRFRLYSMSSLQRLMRNPAKTIILSHSPPRCGRKDSIDVAYTGIVMRSFVLKPKHIRSLGRHAKYLIFCARGEIVYPEIGLRLAKLGYPLSVKHRNVGLKTLTRLLKQKKIRFLACGHIHEAGQRAIDSRGRRLKPGQLSDSVWYNAAPARDGKGGILTIDGNKGTFKNITA